MKKNFTSRVTKFSAVLLLFMFVSLFVFNQDVLATDEGVVQNEDAISYNDLPEAQQNYFDSEGFDENDEYYQTTIVQESNDPLQRFVANVVTMYASSRKISNTMGYTTYTIVSSNAKMYSVDTMLYYGGQGYNSYVNIPWSWDYTGGLYFSYTGKSSYRTIKVSSQVYNSIGSVSVSSNAGGLTLGK